MAENQGKGSNPDSLGPGNRGSGSKKIKDPSEKMREQVRAMFTFAKDKGLEVPARTLEIMREWMPFESKTLESTEPNELQRLTKLHKELSEVIQPSTPKQVAYLISKRESRLGWLGPIPLVRSLIVVAVISLAGFVLSVMADERAKPSGENADLLPDTIHTERREASSAPINIEFGGEGDSIGVSRDADENAGEGVAPVERDTVSKQGNGSDNAPAGTNKRSAIGNDTEKILRPTELLVCFFAAALGAAFVLLYRAQRFLKTDTFDPKFNNEYLVQFVLGLLGGMIFSIALAEALGDPVRDYGRPALALVGGFSVEAVHRLLKRLARILATAVGPDDKEAAQREADAMVREAITEVSLKISEADTLLEGKADVDEARGKLKEILARLKKRPTS